jgi:hypothetical protein
LTDLEAGSRIDRVISRIIWPQSLSPQTGKSDNKRGEGTESSAFTTAEYSFGCGGIATGQYFQSLERWTPDRDDAHDFGIISKAMKVARKIRVPDLELVLSLDEPDEVAATPFEKLLHGLLHTGSATSRAGGRLGPGALP